MTEQMAVPFKTKASELTSGLPLRLIRGVFDSLEPVYENNRLSLKFNISELEVLETIAPWNYPTVQLNFKPSDRKNSTWGILLQSVAKLGHEDLMELQGKRLTLKADPEHEFGGQDADGNAIKGMVWTVTEVEGGAKATGGTNSQSGPAVSDDQALADLADGCDQAQFNQAALASEVGRAHKNDIFGGKTLPDLVSKGLLTVDEQGIYHKVA